MEYISYRSASIWLLPQREPSCPEKTKTNRPYMKIRCLIIDDEPLAVRLVNSYCQQMPELEVVGTCNSAIEAYRVLQQHRVDLLFLDIKMPQLLGTDFIRGLTNPPKVILITAYRKYALDGYDRA